MGTDKTYKYDVAFSFLYSDLSTAQQIRNGLPSSMPVFLFTERQVEIVGKGNGLEVFGPAFRNESRVVVVLYRKGWGDTDWTNVERQEIEERFVKDHSNFLVFIRLDDSQPPPWVRKNRIYLDFNDYGVERAVGVIQYRLQELGATVRAETLTERAARSVRTAAFKKESELLHGSQEGVELAKEEAFKYLNKVETLARELQKSVPELDIKIGTDVGAVGLTTKPKVYLHTSWSNNIVNDLGEATVPIRIYRSGIILPGQKNRMYIGGEYPTPIFEERYKPVRVYGIGWCWESTSEDNAPKTSDELAGLAIRLLLDEIGGEGERGKYQIFFV